MLLCPNKGFLDQHSSATVREKDKIRGKMMILQVIEKVKMSSSDNYKSLKV